MTMVSHCKPHTQLLSSLVLEPVLEMMRFACDRWHCMFEMMLVLLRWLATDFELMVACPIGLLKFQNCPEGAGAEKLRGGYMCVPMKIKKLMLVHLPGPRQRFVGPKK